MLVSQKIFATVAKYTPFRSLRQIDDVESLRMAAFYSSDEKLMFYLLNQGYPEYKYIMRNSSNLDELLFKCSYYGYSSLVGEIIAQGANPDAIGVRYQRPLHFAAKNCHENTVWVLLINGANVNAKDTTFQTPLHLALKKRCEDTANILIRFEASLDEEDLMGYTPRSLMES